MMKMVIFIVAPMLVLMAVLAEPLFRFLFTEKWLPAVPYFQILCVNGILYPLHSYNLNILKVKGRSDLFLNLEIVKKVMLVVVILASFPFGIYGLLYGQVIFSILAYAINTHYSGKFLEYGIWEQFKDILPSLILAGCTGTFTFGLDYLLLNLHDIFRLLISGTAGVAFFLTFATVFKFESRNTAYDIFKNKFKFSTKFNFKRF